jgi:hypothetical protein
LRGRSEHDLIDFSEELFTKPRVLLIVPRGGLFKLMSCRGPKDNAEAHRAKRARIDALISSQGMTWSGNASSSATTPIKLRPLCLRQGKACRIRTDTRPDFLDQCEPLVNIESIYPKRFQRNRHHISFQYAAFPSSPVGLFPIVPQLLKMCQGRSSAEEVAILCKEHSSFSADLASGMNIDFFVAHGWKGS